MPRSRHALEASAVAFAAALIALGQPTLSLWAFGWFGLVPLVVLANASDWKRAAKLGFWAGFGFHVVVTNWVFPTCRFAQVPLAACFLAWFALSAFLALSWAAAAALAVRASSAFPRALRPWLWAVAWTATASFCSRWTPRFGADPLGYSQWTNLSLIQANSWGGPHLLDFLIMLVNACLAEAWIDSREARTDSVPNVAAAFALVAIVWIHGAAVLASRPEPRGPSARVEILQPCVDQYHKWSQAWIDEIMAGYDELLSRPRAGAPALVVWPETAVPRWSRRAEAVPEAAAWAKKLGSPQLVGVVASKEDGSGPANAAQLIAPDGKVDGVYAKRELVPFGEYVPFRSLIPRFVIDRWLMVLDNLGDLEAGAKRQPLLSTAWGPASVTICYEAIFPRWANLDASRGARLSVNVTNDAWYLDTWAPRQHYRVNRFRAIENRFTVIRSGNTGISAVIDPWGVTTAELDLNVRGRLDAEVPLEDPFPARSFYARHGDLIGSFCLILLGLALLRSFP